MKKALTCVFLLLAFGHLVAAEEAKMATIRTVTGDDGIERRVGITMEQAGDLPTWAPEDGNPPPLSLSAALDLAQKAVQARHPRFDTFQAWSIEMSRVSRQFSDRWFYVVSFRPIVDGIVLSGPHSEYMEYVLMDGTVLDPRIMTPARTE